MLKCLKRNSFIKKNTLSLWPTYFVLGTMGTIGTI